MKLNMYAVYDSASGVYDGPSKARSHPEAIRAFTYFATDAESPIGRNPEDFTLVCVGEWDDTTGLIVSERVESVCTALECVAATRQTDTAKLAMLDKVAAAMNGEDEHAA